MRNDYPYIRAYGRLIGSNADWIEGEIARARRDNAPQDAWTYSLTERKWSTMASLFDRGNINPTAADTYQRIKKMAGE